MAARLAALRHHPVHAGPLQRKRFVDGGGRPHQPHSALFDRRDGDWRQQTECETNQGGAAFKCSDQLRVKVVGGVCGRRWLRQSEFGVEWRDPRERRPEIRGRRRGQRREEIDAKRSAGARAHRARTLGDLGRCEVGGADASESAGLGHGRHQLRRVAAPGQRRLHDGVGEPQAFGQNSRHRHVYLHRLWWRAGSPP